MSAVVRIALPVAKRTQESGLKSLTLGIRTARARPVLRRLLVTMFSFSLFSLPFVGLFPAVADLTFGIQPRTPVYKWLYATWGLGAMFGALAIGTVLAGVDKRQAARGGFVCFAIFKTAENAGALNELPMPTVSCAKNRTAIELSIEVRIPSITDPAIWMHCANISQLRRLNLSAITPAGMDKRSKGPN